MRQWTPEERQRQRELIRHWRPWKKAGVKTQEGKAKSRMNALKHGAYSAETKATRYLLRECRDVIVLANQYIRALRQRERLEKAIALKNKGSHSAKKTKTAERINKPEGATPHHGPNRASDYRAIGGDSPLLSHARKSGNDGKYCLENALSFEPIIVAVRLNASQRLSVAIT